MLVPPDVLPTPRTATWGICPNARPAMQVGRQAGRQAGQAGHEITAIYAASCSNLAKAAVQQSPKLGLRLRSKGREGFQGLERVLIHPHALDSKSRASFILPVTNLV